MFIQMSYPGRYCEGYCEGAQRAAEEKLQAMHKREAELKQELLNNGTSQADIDALLERK